MLLDELLVKLSALPEADQKAIKQAALDATKGLLWIPSPGPQTEAFSCQADELFFGGEAGGGKSDLILGLAATEHTLSLVLRRTNKEADKLVERLAGIIGHRSGLNTQDGVWRLPGGRVIDIGGCQLEEDKQKRKGAPHDFIGYDEIADFSETQFRFINGWNRSVVPGQRCRVVAAGNPPTTAEGLWVVRYWAPWLDENHANPAKPGELRWFTTIDGKDAEVDGPGPHLIDGELIIARSRTFIRSRLSDNLDLARTNYGSVLAGLPAELRAAYKDGKFSASLRDDDFQVIPSDWIAAAQARWQPDGYKGLAMTAIGLDVAGGGADETVLAARYGGWYAPLVTQAGEQAKDPAAPASLVVRHRKDRCPVVIDVGGGYGGGALVVMRENGIDYLGFNGATASRQKTVDGQLNFANKRAEAVWRFREALNPEQEGGSVVALPPDTALRADLAAYRWKPLQSTLRGIQIESKDDIRERLGRSPDRGDAVIMALSEGERAVAKKHRRSSAHRHPEVNVGFSAMKKTRPTP